MKLEKEDLKEISDLLNEINVVDSTISVLHASSKKIVNEETSIYTTMEIRTKKTKPKNDNQHFMVVGGEKILIHVGHPPPESAEFNPIIRHSIYHAIALFGLLNPP